MTVAPLLHARSITVTRGNRRIVDSADITLAPGELTVLAGPNGAGKTTLARAIAGLIACEGTITLGGTPLSAMTLRERARMLAYLPQGHEFHWPMRVDAIVALGREPHADPFSQRTDADRAAIRRAIAATSIEPFADRLITTLSGGECARVAIARALATEASVLIADEPTASLDERHRLIVMDLLRNIARRGAAVIAIVHNLSLAMRYADRIVLMNEGRVVASGPPQEALTTERIADVFGVAVQRIDTPEGPVLLPSRAL